MNQILLLLAAAGGLGLWITSLVRGGKVASLTAALKKSQDDAAVAPIESALDVMKDSLAQLEAQRLADEKAYRDSLTPPPTTK